MLSHSSEFTGGGEMSMVDLLDYWASKDLIEPNFIIRRPLKDMVPQLEKRGWNYYPLYYTNWSQRSPSQRAEDIIRNARYNAEAVAEIERIIQELKPDVVMTNTIVSPWGALAAYFQRVPHIWFVREYGDIDHQHVFELGREKMLADIDTLSDLVITNSKTLAEHVKKYVTPKKVQPLYTPFDLELLERKSKTPVDSPFKYEDSLKLVMIGRIAPSKGQDEAAQAVGELKKQGLRAELCIIGKAAAVEDADSLKKVIEKYGIADRVHLIGQQPNEITLAIVSHADVGIMASQREAFGRVTFEYMATGLPVVGSNSGATPEFIDDGQNGFLYEKGKVETLIRPLLKYAKDKKLVARHGAAAKLKTRAMMQGEYSADKVFERLKAAITAERVNKQPLNFARRWLDYPLIAQQYIDGSRAMSLRGLLYSRARSKLKAAYLFGPGIVKKAALPFTPYVPKKIRPAKMESAYKKRQLRLKGQDKDQPNE